MRPEGGRGGSNFVPKSMKPSSIWWSVRGNLISKQELMQGRVARRFCHGRLARAVCPSNCARALSDRGQQFAQDRTPRRGYLFTAEVVPALSEDGASPIT